MKETRNFGERLAQQMALEQEVVGIGWLLDDLHRLGVDALADFKDIDSQELFMRWKSLTHKDNSLALCIFRCAVYLANTPVASRDPKLSKWWNWA